MLFSTDVRRLSLAQLRAQYKPRYFASLRSVEVIIDGQCTTIDLVTDVGHGCISVPRRWLRCHHCGRNANVLAYVRGFEWACKRCLGWRARSRTKPTVPAPSSVSGA